MTWAGLLARHLRLSGGRWAVLALVVALTSALTMAWPRWLAATATDELRRDLSGSSSSFVDPAAAPGWLPIGTVATGAMDAGGGVTTSDGAEPAAGAWDSLETSLEQFRATLPDPLRSVLGEAGVWQTWEAIGTFDAAVTDRDAMSLQLAGSPELFDHARVVEGRVPAPDAPPVADPDDADAPYTLEIAMSVDSAEGMRWHVGDVRETSSQGPNGRQPLRVELVGTFQPDDPLSSYWQNAAPLLRPSTVYGTNGITVTARGVVSDGAGLSTAMLTAPTADSRIWYSLDVDRIDSADAATLADQMRTELESVDVTPQVVGQHLNVTLATDAPRHIDEVLARAGAAQSVLGLAVAAPAGVLLALLALAAQVVVAPRRAAHLLTSLRGGSLLQHRTLLGTEAGLVCLPAAAIGGLVAQRLLPASVGPWWWLGPAVLGLVPVLALATAAPTPRSAPAPRVAVEVGVLVLAAAAVVELVRRGIGGGAGTDALAIAAPLLLAVVTALVCARVVPLLLRPLAVRLTRRDDLVTPLGAALAARRPQPVVASVATVAGTAVAILGVLATSTIDAGRGTAALRDVGADVRVLGSLDDAQVDSLRGIPGVAQVATVTATSSIGLQTGANTRVVMTLYSADAALTGVQRGVPGAVAVPAPGAIAISAPVAIATGDTANVAVTPRTQLTVVAKPEAAPGLTTAQTWMLVDRRSVEGSNIRPVVTAAYLRLTGDADPAAVAAAVRGAVDPDVNVATAYERLEQLRTAPTARALSTGILVVVVAGLLAAMLAVALALAARTAARTRVVAVLRTMGLPPRAEMRLVLWEATPSVAVAVVAGTGLGFALTRLLLTSVDVRPFTGGDVQPPLVVGAGFVAALGAVLVVAAAAVVVSAWAAARRSAAVVLRAGEERT